MVWLINLLTQKKTKKQVQFTNPIAQKTNEADCCFGFFSAPFGKRSWKMFYCTLRDLVLYLHKDEHGFRKNQVSLLSFGTHSKCKYK
jgi:hypothetical protein